MTKKYLSQILLETIKGLPSEFLKLECYTCGNIMNNSVYQTIIYDFLWNIKSNYELYSNYLKNADNSSFAVDGVGNYFIDEMKSKVVSNDIKSTNVDNVTTLIKELKRYAMFYPKYPKLSELNTFITNSVSNTDIEQDKIYSKLNEYYISYQVFL